MQYAIINSAKILYAMQQKIYVSWFAYRGSIVDNNGPPRQRSRWAGVVSASDKCASIGSRRAAVPGRKHHRTMAVCEFHCHGSNE